VLLCVPDSVCVRVCVCVCVRAPLCVPRRGCVWISALRLPPDWFCSTINRQPTSALRLPPGWFSSAVNSSHSRERLKCGPASCLRARAYASASAPRCVRTCPKVTWPSRASVHACACVRVYVHVCARVGVCTCEWAHLRTHAPALGAHMHLCVHAFTCYAHVYACLSMCAQKHTFVDVCMSACMKKQVDMSTIVQS